jgi:hypothetical protein
VTLLRCWVRKRAVSNDSTTAAMFGPNQLLWSSRCSSNSRYCRQIGVARNSAARLIAPPRIHSGERRRRQLGTVFVSMRTSPRLTVITLVVKDAKKQNQVELAELLRRERIVGAHHGAQYALTPMPAGTKTAIIRGGSEDRP